LGARLEPDPGPSALGAYATGAILERDLRSRHWTRAIPAVRERRGRLDVVRNWPAKRHQESNRVALPSPRRHDELGTGAHDKSLHDNDAVPVAALLRTASLALPTPKW
jgi:hypothetical protein